MFSGNHAADFDDFHGGYIKWAKRFQFRIEMHMDLFVPLSTISPRGNQKDPKSVEPMTHVGLCFDMRLEMVIVQIIAFFTIH